MNAQWSRALLIACLLLGCSALDSSRAADAPQLKVDCPAEGTVFERCELRVSLPEALAGLSSTQVHDAWDADRDGQYIRLEAAFEHEGTSLAVPGLALREKPDGPWVWRVRFAPRLAGTWKVRVRLDARAGGRDFKLAEETHSIEVRAAAKLLGPLAVPGKDDPPQYLRRLKPDGTSEALWLFGACRAWVVDLQDPNNNWFPHEYLDRETELFAPMRAGGFNLLNQWMAPWEFLVIHHDRAEFWKEEGKWRRVPLAKDAAWTSYQCYDQGRAKAFDELLGLCEGDADKPPIYLLLSPMSHQCLQVKEHPWGGQESGWSPENDAGKQTLERLNGFSGLRPKMDIWEFFEANPRKPLDDWRSQLFDHQANYYRYLIARWGYSRAVGVWVLVDELDAVGNVVGKRAEKTGWWGHPQCERWLADVVRLFRGELIRSDGLAYGGDPYRHPLHAATTSYGGEAGRGGNIDWEGGPVGARPDLFGFHWYPHWNRGTNWTGVWTYTIDGVANYASAPIGNVPRLISEFGAPDRDVPKDKPAATYPTLFHHAIWAAVFSGQTGTPMDWDDGKQFGELRWRERKGIFDQEHYPIDYVQQMQALRSFLGDAAPDALRPCGPKAAVRCQPAGTLRALVLFRADKTDGALGWVFAPGEDTRLTLEGLAAGSYELQWFDPWTGAPVPDLAVKTLACDGKAAVEVNAFGALNALRAKAESFPEQSRLARGQDAAFKLVRKDGAKP